MQLKSGFSLLLLSVALTSSAPTAPLRVDVVGPAPVGVLYQPTS
ncbi:MAG: hypothetical protein ACK5DD_13660 [Cyclobacteriaceae bacterium]